MAHKWLGHILRMPAIRLVRCAVLALGQRAGPPYQPRILLMDMPLPLNELVLLAADRQRWARDNQSLSSHQEIHYGVGCNLSCWNNVLWLWSCSTDVQFRFESYQRKSTGVETSGWEEVSSVPHGQASWHGYFPSRGLRLQLMSMICSQLILV